MTPEPTGRSRNGSQSAPVSTWTRLRASLAWCLQSWVRPAGSASRWEQQAGREQAAWEDSSGQVSRDNTNNANQAQGAEGRQQATKSQGTGT